MTLIFPNTKKERNEEEWEDFALIYDSEISSNYSFFEKRDSVKIEDFPSKTQNRWQWLKYKLRESMILEAVFFLILFFLLITCYRITFQNEETQKMISSIQSQLNLLQKQETEDDFMINKKEETEEIIKNEYEKIKEVSEEVWEEVRTESIVNLKSSTTPSVPINFTPKRFNAASLIAGATVESSLSSSSNLTPLFGYDQSSMVLVDRPEAPANKTWCTYENEPVLIINLARYIKPTAVSYQHSKWNGTIPADAPKVYSVEACLDYDCMNMEPLFSNCEYNSNGLQEQTCNITNHSIDSLIGKLQFRFQKNHGHIERTCVSLVRVYSDSEYVPEKKLRSLEDTKTCSDLKNDYDNNPLTYQYFDSKNCSLLYSKGCCQECPECCEECDIKDIDREEVFRNTVIVIYLFILFYGLFNTVVEVYWIKN